jgi:hypothetical protein
LAWHGCALAGVGLLGDRLAAGIEKPPTAQTGEDLMAGRDAESAPYSVRLKITGFLARQHAREGDSVRALREFHSMLSTDDPAWPDNEEGDAMRIARDMEVARMMAESGFYDHSIRVLETASILAQTNRDPQADIVERQIESVNELARMHGRPLPPTGPVELRASARPLPPASRVEEDEEPVHQSAGRTEPPALLPSVKPATTAERSQNPARVPYAPQSPHSVMKSAPQADEPRTAPKQEEKSLSSRIIPSRWRDKEAAASQEPAPQQTELPRTEVADRQPVYSPNVSPHFCPECAAHASTTARRIAAPPAMAGANSPGTHRRSYAATKHTPRPDAHNEPSTTAANKSATADKSTVRVTSGEHSPSARGTTATPVAATPAEKPKRGVLNKLAAARASKNGQSTAPATEAKTIPLTPPVVTESEESESRSTTTKRAAPAGIPLELAALDGQKSPPVKTSVVSPGAKGNESEDARPDGGQASDLGSGSPSSTGRGPTAADTKPSLDREPSPLKLEPTPSSDTATDTGARLPTEHESAGLPVEQSAAPNASTANKPDELASAADLADVSQIGVAGSVSTPGIFAVRGHSTTLGTALSRAGALAASQKSRAVRTIGLGLSDTPTGTQIEFYLHRVEISESESDAMATPIFGQEIVIVDGDGPRPIYLAIMPHFILQLPALTDRPTTAMQILEQLRTVWPTIGEQDIGVLRYEDWGRTAKVAQAKPDSAELVRPLAGGDVLYVDGFSLDSQQVLKAAEAVARSVGAKIRQAQ